MGVQQFVPPEEIIKRYPKAPLHKINWGMIDRKCEQEMIQWIQDVISCCGRLGGDLKMTAELIFEEVRSLGYSEGYDACDCDHEGDGI